MLAHLKRRRAAWLAGSLAVVVTPLLILACADATGPEAQAQRATPATPAVLEQTFSASQPAAGTNIAAQWAIGSYPDVRWVEVHASGLINSARPDGSPITKFGPNGNYDVSCTEGAVGVTSDYGWTSFGGTCQLATKENDWWGQGFVSGQVVASRNGHACSDPATCVTFNGTSTVTVTPVDGWRPRLDPYGDVRHFYAGVDPNPPGPLVRRIVRWETHYANGRGDASWCGQAWDCWVDFGQATISVVMEINGFTHTATAALNMTTDINLAVDSSLVTSGNTVRATATAAPGKFGGDVVPVTDAKWTWTPDTPRGGDTTRTLSCNANSGGDSLIVCPITVRRSGTVKVTGRWNGSTQLYTKTQHVAIRPPRLKLSADSLAVYSTSRVRFHATSLPDSVNDHAVQLANIGWVWVSDSGGTRDSMTQCAGEAYCDRTVLRAGTMIASADSPDLAVKSDSVHIALVIPDLSVSAVQLGGASGGTMAGRAALTAATAQTVRDARVLMRVGLQPWTGTFAHLAVDEGSGVLLTAHLSPAIVNGSSVQYDSVHWTAHAGDSVTQVCGSDLTCELPSVAAPTVVEVSARITGTTKRATQSLTLGMPQLTMGCSGPVTRGEDVTCTVQFAARAASSATWTWISATASDGQATSLVDSTYHEFGHDAFPFAGPAVTNTTLQVHARITYRTLTQDTVLTASFAVRSRMGAGGWLPIAFPSAGQYPEDFPADTPVLRSAHPFRQDTIHITGAVEVTLGSDSGALGVTNARPDSLNIDRVSGGPNKGWYWALTPTSFNNTWIAISRHLYPGSQFRLAQNGAPVAAGAGQTWPNCSQSQIDAVLNSTRAHEHEHFDSTRAILSSVDLQDALEHVAEYHPGAGYRPTVVDSITSRLFYSRYTTARFWVDSLHKVQLPAHCLFQWGSF